MPCRPFNCSIQAPHKLEPNPDISGIGVVIGFVASGWATLLFLMLRFVIAPSKSDQNFSDLLDNTLRNGVSRVLGTWAPSRGWLPAIETLVLTMSDQQLVTGLSIILSGYSQLHCDISLYHWKLITLLAWFSSATHLATLLFLRQYLQRNRWVWYVRVLLMTALAIMLAVAIVPTSHVPTRTVFNEHFASWETQQIPGIPAWCAVSPTTREMELKPNMVPMVFSEIILLGSLSIRLMEMSTTIKRLSGGSLKTALGRLPRRFLSRLCEKLQKSHKGAQALLMPLVVFLLAFLISMQNALDFLGSDACGVLWLLFSLTWGTIRLFLERHGGEENEWGFGQLVPVLLLLMPALLIVEGFSEAGSRAKDSYPLVGCMNYNDSTSPNVQSQADMQAVPTRASTVDTAAVSCNIALGNTPPLGCSGNALCARVQYLCNHDFRDELWYLDNLFLILFYVTGAACAILGVPFLNTEGQFYGQDILYVVLIFVGAGLTSVPAIPLCGVVSSILRSEGRPPFLIRLAIDSGKRYRVCRRIFYFYAPITGILFSIVVPSYLPVALAPLYVWCGICGMMSFYAFFRGLFSIYSQLLSSDRSGEYT